MNNKQELYLQKIEVDGNSFIAIGDSDELWWLSFDRVDSKWVERYEENYHIIQRECEVHQCLKKELEEYYKNPSYEFKVPVHFEGTEFQVEVMKELQKVKSGETLSYGELAQRVGNPKAYRAVASAMKNNPLAIIVPCHRVNLANDKISKYAGGIEKKLQLLTHEGWGALDY